MPTNPGQKSVWNSSSLPKPDKNGRATEVASMSIHSFEPLSRSRKRRPCTFHRPMKKSKSWRPVTSGTLSFVVATRLGALSFMVGAPFWLAVRTGDGREQREERKRGHTGDAVAV